MLPEELHPAGEKVEIIQRLIVEEQRAEPESKREKENADHPGQAALQHAGAVQKSQTQQTFQDQDDDHTNIVVRNSHRNLKELPENNTTCGQKRKWPELPLPPNEI